MSSRVPYRIFFKIFGNTYLLKKKLEVQVQKMPVWIPVRLRGTAVVGGIQKPDHKLLLTHKDDEDQNNYAMLMTMIEMVG